MSSAAGATSCGPATWPSAVGTASAAVGDAFAAAHPDDYGGWCLKGRCLDMLGRYDDALAAYATAGALRPNSPARSSPGATWRSATAATWPRRRPTSTGP